MNESVIFNLFNISYLHHWTQYYLKEHYKYSLLKYLLIPIAINALSSSESTKETIKSISHGYLDELLVNLKLLDIESKTPLIS